MPDISFPTSPTLNQTYSIGSKTWKWNSYAWDLQISSTKYTASTSPPANPFIGDQWYKSDVDILYEYITDGVSTYWVDTSTQAISATNTAIDNNALATFLLAGM
jgi:ABC-type glycerol-3-phosphate transport system permease component